MWGDQQDAAANKVTCALVLPGDMAAGRQINRATAGSRDKFKGGQTCAAEFSMLLTSRQTAMDPRIGGRHRGTH